jgi:hypothetical protein
MFDVCIPFIIFPIVPFIIADGDLKGELHKSSNIEAVIPIYKTANLQKFNFFLSNIFTTPTQKPDGKANNDADSYDGGKHKVREGKYTAYCTIIYYIHGYSHNGAVHGTHHPRHEFHHIHFGGSRP